MYQLHYMNREEQVHRAVVEYLEIAYRDTWYKSDLSGENMKGFQAREKQRMAKQRGFPDLTVYPRNRIFGALYIEIKREGTILARKGSWATEHIREQAEWVSHLNQCGHVATFGIGTDHCIQVIDALMTNNLERLSQLMVDTVAKAEEFQMQNSKKALWHQLQQNNLAKSSRSRMRR